MGTVKVRELQEYSAPWRHTALEDRHVVRCSNDAAAKRLKGRGDGRNVVLLIACAVVNVHESDDVC
jgi:hypothetical protein